MAQTLTAVFPTNVRFLFAFLFFAEHIPLASKLEPVLPQITPVAQCDQLTPRAPIRVEGFPGAALNPLAASCADKKGSLVYMHL